MCPPTGPSPPPRRGRQGTWSSLESIRTSGHTLSWPSMKPAANLPRGRRPRPLTGILNCWAGVAPGPNAPGPWRTVETADLLRAGEAVRPIIRGMLRGEEPSATGPRYAARHVRNDPPPVQARLPILVGGGGEKVTLKLVAQYADANNVGDGFENVKRKEAILREHCERIGRDEREIERTTGVGVVVIRDSRAEAQRVSDRLFENNRVSVKWQDQPISR